MAEEEKVKPWKKYPPFRFPTAVIPNVDSDNNNKPERIAKQFWPLICLLRIFGFYPISKVPSSSSEKVEETQVDPEISSTVDILGGRRKVCSRKFRRKILFESCFWRRAKITVYSYGILGLNLFCWIVFICNIGLGLKFPLDLARLPHDVHSHHNSTEDEAPEEENRLVILAEGLLKFLEMFHLIVNSDLFTEWLNNWNDFEMEFRKYFGGKNITLNFDIRKFCYGSLIFYSFLPSLLKLGMGVKANLNYWHNPEYLILSYFIFFWMDILLVVHSLLEDSKTFLMLRSLKMTYEQVRFAINEDVNVGTISDTDVVQWGKIAHSVRKQITLCSEYIKGRQILILLDTVIVFSGGIFSLLELSREDFSHRYFLLANILLVCILSYIRLYLTVYLAHTIYEEETQLGNDILEMPTETMDDATKLELKFLYSALCKEPRVINLGNYINLNKSLIVKVGFTVLALLIAIMEFHHGNSKC